MGPWELAVIVEIFGVPLEIDETRVAATPAAIEREVREYERGERTTFDLEVAIPDDFTGRVMDRMQAIPYGETVTYGDIAATLETAPIAVGGACGRNPVPIVVPCHRVIGADGSLTGYSGGGDRGLELKARLLEHERAVRRAAED